ncbi:MAG: hypothetical protein GF363_15270 [Chitinivibrionales bacterium]|nr:hypothetical protein [Chitinivibrionales bacterium]
MGLSSPFEQTDEPQESLSDFATSEKAEGEGLEVIRKKRKTGHILGAIVRRGNEIDRSRARPELQLI